MDSDAQASMPTRISNLENRFEESSKPSPGGTCDNSPTFQRWVDRAEISSPEGAAETVRDPSAVPSGLTTIYLVLPNVETLGYCRASLRDEGTNLSGVGAQALGLTSPRLWLINSAQQPDCL